MLPATPIMNVVMVSQVCDGPVPRGGGRRAAKAWLGERPCCLRARLSRVKDGRWRCEGCGYWYSVSHSDTLLALARSGAQVGVDVQRACRRPAAMRWFSRICALREATIDHWAAAEAIVKAVGHAGRRPLPGQLKLPSTFGDAATECLFDGRALNVRVFRWNGASLAIAVVKGRQE